MITAYGIVIAIVLIALGDLVVGRLLSLPVLNWQSVKHHAPEEFWKALKPAQLEGAGRLLGTLERTIAALAAWTGAYELLGGWFALKVASKWETYANVLRLPDELPGISPIDYLRARRVWGSRAMMRFLVGSGANALTGVAAALLGKHAAPSLVKILAG